MNFKVKIGEHSSKEYCSWEEVEFLIKLLADRIQKSNKKYDVILGITNGGIIPARLMARELDNNYIQLIPVRNKKLHREELPLFYENKKYLVIDEICDTGNTFSKVADALKVVHCDFAFLISRYKHNSGALVGKILNHNKWVVFPWERKGGC